MSDIAGAVVSWFWDKYGKDLADKAFGKIKNQWDHSKWKEAEELYRIHLREQNRFTRLLGNPKPIDIENIYTDVYILDRVLAKKQYSGEELYSIENRSDFLSWSEEKDRHPLLRLALNEKRLYLLGKPGSGKTTFLRYLALQACQGKIPLTPIFIELRDWAASDMDLITYLVRQFDICNFSNAKEFVEHLLKNGHALVLFDGLDEVNQEGNKRSKIIRLVKDFARQYPETHICLTCRIAAIEYVFEQFTYLEIADFSANQVRQFALKWYQEEPEKGLHFLNQLDKPENQALKELTRTPLLLALLCLAFDQTLSFPSNRTLLYKEAFDTLLKKWDKTRLIERDEVYRKLSYKGKEKLLASLAAENFEKGAFFIRNSILANQISSYLMKYQNIEDREEIDGEDILKAIEAQHGILVERSQNTYSFSHLTFQEYLTACFIVENYTGVTLESLIRSHITESLWREVFIMTASLLEDASDFIRLIQTASSEMVTEDPALYKLYEWARGVALWVPYNTRVSHNLNILIFLAYALTLVVDGYSSTTSGTFALNFIPTLILILDLASEISFQGVRATNLARTRAVVRALQHAQVLAHDLTSNPQNKEAIIFGIRYVFEKFIGINPSSDKIKLLLKLIRFDHITKLDLYLEANRLIIDCLKFATVKDKSSIFDRMFILPGEATSPLYISKENSIIRFHKGNFHNPLLIIVSNDIEADAVFREFDVSTWPSSKRMVQFKKLKFIDLGFHNDIPVILFLSDWPFIDRDQAISNLELAIHIFHPKALIICGIAYGVTPRDQQEGEILISKQIASCKYQNSDSEPERIIIGDRIPVSDQLHTQFWKKDMPAMATRRTGLILVGEDLADPTLAKKILNRAPYTIGLEVEGPTLYIASRKDKLDWILVKGVSDFVGGLENRITKDKAARNAANYVRQVIIHSAWNKSQKSDDE